MTELSAHREQECGGDSTLSFMQQEAPQTEGDEGPLRDRANDEIEQVARDRVSSVRPSDQKDVAAVNGSDWERAVYEAFG